MADKLVRFWCMRHGKKSSDADALSRFGDKQVQASARKNLRDVPIDIAFHSGMQRARQTVRTALLEVARSVQVFPHEGFGFSETSTSLVPSFPMAEARKRIGRPDQETVYDWLQHWPPAWYLRGLMQGTLFEVSLAVVRNPDFDPLREINVLVAGHSPGLEMASLAPAARPCLKEADIMIYEVVVPEAGRPFIAREDYLPCPLEEELKPQ